MRSKGKKPDVNYGPLSLEAVRALILEKVALQPHLTNPKLAALLNDEHNISINKSVVRDAIRDALVNRTLTYHPQADDALSRDVKAKAKLPQGHSVHVLNTASPQHVGEKVAEFLLDQITADKLRDQPEIHVGFFGGRTNSFVAQKMVELLRHRAANETKTKVHSDPPDNRRLVLHSLVGVLDSDDPETDPNTFPVYFIHRREVIERFLHRRLRFKKFTMPGLVTNEEFKTLSHLHAVRHSFSQRPTFDYILASCGHYGCEYTFTDYIESGTRDRPDLTERLGRLRQYLAQHQVIGDIAWHPIANGGRMVDLTEMPLRVATLFTLPELQCLHLTSPNTRVILAAGPCSQKDCKESKAKLFKWAIETTPLVAHDIFTDRHTAEDYKNGR